jgi:hypothetical protein
VTTDTLDLTNTKAALPKWIATEEKLYQDLYAVRTADEAAAWEEQWQAAANAFCDAFYEDTKDRNNQHDCRSVHPTLVETGKWR